MSGDVSSLAGFRYCVIILPSKQDDHFVYVDMDSLKDKKFKNGISPE
jgi:hypothetical protein